MTSAIGTMTPTSICETMFGFSLVTVDTLSHRCKISSGTKDAVNELDFDVAVSFAMHTSAFYTFLLALLGTREVEHG
jgi:hypothetical protein